MAKRKSNRRRRSDYAARLAARRKDAVAAYFKALGGPKDEAAQLEAIANDADVKVGTFNSYLSGKQDMGRKACERLQAKLDAEGKVLSDYSSDPYVQSNGVWIFANPNRRAPFLPQQVRERRATKVLELLKQIAQALGLKSTADEEVFKKIAEVTGLKPNSIYMVATSCSYLAADRVALLDAALKKKGKELDLSLLSQDPRNLEDSELDDYLEEENGDAENGDNEKPQIQEVAGVLAKLGVNDVLLITGSGQYEMFTQESAAVVVIRPGAQLAVHSVPAGCVVQKGSLMSSSDGSGVVSVPFKPHTEG